MKRLIALLVACLMLLGLVGCGGPAGEKTSQLVLATGGTAGTYYPYGGAMSQIFNSKIPNMNVTAQSTGASVENLRLVNKKEADLAIVQSDMMDYAYKGTEAFKEKLTNVNAIAILYPEIIQVVVRADSNIKSIADLKGKTLGVGAPGSGTEANSRQLLDTYDLNYNMVTPHYLSFSESAERFKDKQIDAFVITAGIPNSAIQDIATQQSVRILSLPDEMINKITAKYPFLVPIIIPANTYKGQTEDVKTVAVLATLIVNSQLSEQVVYNLTKALFENQQTLASAHAKGKELSLENAIKGISIPVHPGALKYYKEKGIVK